MTIPLLPSGPEQTSLAPAQVGGLEGLFSRVFRRMGLRRPAPSFQVEFRPFASLRSAIRRRDNHLVVHISDLLREAPPLVQEALAEILLTRVFGRRPSREAQECYMAHVLSPAVRQRIDQTRRQRGRKRLRGPQGRHFNLDRIFQRLNRLFFGGKLARPRLGWSLKRSRALLGHYDSAHQTIAISRLLDSPRVPRYLVEYLVFHEMLHIRYPVERDGHRRVIHSRQFREAEKKFPQFERARRRLKLIST